MSRLATRLRALELKAAPKVKPSGVCAIWEQDMTTNLYTSDRYPGEALTREELAAKRSSDEDLWIIVSFTDTEMPEGSTT